LNHGKCGKCRDHGLNGGQMDGDCVKLLGHGLKSIEGGTEERNENSYAIGEIVKLPVIVERDLIRGEGPPVTPFV